mgnify:CR=1 FL=1
MEPANWLNLQRLIKALGVPERTIAQLKSENYLIPGVHFYAIGTGLGRGGKQVYSLELCRKALLERTKKLAEEQAKKNQGKKSESFDDAHLNQLVSAVARS